MRHLKAAAQVWAIILGTATMIVVLLSVPALAFVAAFVVLALLFTGKLP